VWALVIPVKTNALIWALIRRLAAEGVPNTRIAERLGISRTTVIKAV